LIAALAVALLLATGVLGAAHAGWYRSNDFYALYTGARMTALGQDPYDEIAWCAATEGVTPEARASNGTPVCVTRYAYPAWTALAMVPLGALSLPVAASLWLAFSIGAAVLGARWCWLAVRGPARSAPIFAALVFCGEPFWLMVGGGQVSGVLMAGVGLTAWLLASGRERDAGFALSLFWLKPHILGLAAAALLVRAAAHSSWRFVAAATASLAGLFAVTIVVDPLWPVKLVREIVGRQAAHSVDLATAWGLAAHDLGALALAPLLIVALAASALWLAGGIPRAPVSFTALAVPLAIFATPYAWSYDFVPLALPWALVVARAGRASAPTRRALLVALIVAASLAPWLLYALAFRRETETLSAVVPALAALLVAAVIRSEPSA